MRIAGLLAVILTVRYEVSGFRERRNVGILSDRQEMMTNTAILHLHHKRYNLKVVTSCSS